MTATIYGAADRAYAFVPVAVQAANYTAQQNQLVPVDATGAARTVTLPTAPPDQTVVCVKKVAGGNNVTVATGAGDVFNVAGGPTTWTLSLVGQSTIAQYSAAAAIWFILGDAMNGTITGNLSVSGKGSFGDQVSITSSDAAGALFITQSVATSGNPGTISQQEAASTDGAYAVFAAGDNHARFTLRADGQMQWGPGNAALDTTLRRTSAGLLEILNALTVDGAVSVNTSSNGAVLITGSVNGQQLFRAVGADVTTVAFETQVTTDTVHRFVARTTGTLEWGPGTGARDTLLGRVSAGYLGVTTGSMGVTTAGQGLRVAEGANAKQGTAVLVAGTVTVANTSVTANSRIFVGQAVPGGTVGAPFISSQTTGTGFTIKSTSATDTSTVAYIIFEPA